MNFLSSLQQLTFSSSLSTSSTNVLNQSQKYTWSISKVGSICVSCERAKPSIWGKCAADFKNEYVFGRMCKALSFEGRQPRLEEKEERRCYASTIKPDVSYRNTVHRRFHWASRPWREAQWKRRCTVLDFATSYQKLPVSCYEKALSGRKLAAGW